MNKGVSHCVCGREAGTPSFAITIYLFGEDGCASQLDARWSVNILFADVESTLYIHASMAVRQAWDWLGNVRCSMLLQAGRQAGRQTAISRSAQLH